MKRLFTLFFMLGAFVMAQAQVDAEMTIKKASKLVVVDGAITADDPWTEEGWVDAAIGKEGQTTDMTGKFQLMFNDSLLFGAAWVQDPTPMWAEGDTYKNDCTEWFFCFLNERPEDGTYAALATWQFRCQREPEDPEKYLDGNLSNTWSIAALTGDPNFAYISASSGTEYIQEFIWPFAALNSDNPEEWNGDVFYFDIQIADATEPQNRTQQQFWAGNSDDQWRNSMTFGTVTLDKTSSIKPLTTSNATAFMQNNLLKVTNYSGEVNIIDLKGVVVRRATIYGNGYIDVADLRSGLYIAKGDNLSVKFVK
jgi:hypothetical protein